MCVVLVIEPRAFTLSCTQPWCFLRMCLSKTLKYSGWAQTWGPPASALQSAAVVAVWLALHFPLCLFSLLIWGSHCGELGSLPWLILRALCPSLPAILPPLRFASHQEVLPRGSEGGRGLNETPRNTEPRKERRGCGGEQRTLATEKGLSLFFCLPLSDGQGLCVHNKNHWTLPFHWANFMVCEYTSIKP